MASHAGTPSSMGGGGGETPRRSSVMGGPGSGGGGGGAGGGAATNPVVALANLKKQQQQQQYAATTLPPTIGFPPAVAITNELSTHLQPFKDDTSAYATVCKSCCQLSQFCHLSCAQSVQDDTTLSSNFFHDATYADGMSQCFAALIECIQTHKDRRCRSLACTTLALLAKSSYVRLRPSPLLYSTADQSRYHQRIQDEIGSEVPSALLTCALNDDDDGVSATAVQALGILILSSSIGTGTIASQPIPDLLFYHVYHMSSIRPSIYAPSLSQLVDVNETVVQTELSNRIVENILAPRNVQLLDRIYLYASYSAKALTLPTVTHCLVHQLRISNSALFTMDNRTFAKRWSEVDIVSTIDNLVTGLLLPAVQQYLTCGTLANAAAWSLLKFVGVCSARSSLNWATDACAWSIRVWQDEIQTSLGYASLEQTLTTLCAMLIAARQIPIHESRHSTLIWIATQLVALVPSTITAPFGISCAGLLVDFGGSVNANANAGSIGKQYRRPVRIALWTEIALSYFVDGPGGLPNELYQGQSTAADANKEGGGMSGVGLAGFGGGQREQPPLRHELLQSFLTTGPVGKIIADRNRSLGGVLPFLDEILLAFTTVAVETGRRFRVTADGTIMLVDHEAPELLEWVRLSHVVLTMLSPCINIVSPESSSMNVLLEEDQSMLMAAQASYMRLLQEYLYMTGLIHPESSVAFKLTPNACPHLLWVQMPESANFLSKLETVDLNEDDKGASKLMDDLVQREIKQGVSSHHLRLFLLTMAADHWIQGRMLTIRKHLESGAPPANIDHNLLRMPSAREILLALSPKRLLAKMMESSSSAQQGDAAGGAKNPKRDPVKKLAPEILKASVACIEGIALIACDWRRRFGSSQETKQIVSVAVGLLQGKGNEANISPSDAETMRALMSPLCDAAVGRIQAFYESNAGDITDPTFPVSELVAHHVKPKIKPLITALKAPNLHKDKIAKAYLMQLCQQIIMARIEQCVYSCPPADSLLASARPTNWLRLDIPPIPESKDARSLGCYADVLAAWGTSVNLTSAASDAVALVAAYTPRKYVRHDGEDEYRLAILIRAFNTTPISLFEGLRLDVGVYQRIADPKDTEDPASLDVVESLGGDVTALTPEGPLACSSAGFRSEIKSGEFVTWEVSLDQRSPVRNAVILPSVVYRNVKVETPESVGKWVGDKPGASGDASTVGGASKSGEDDFQVTGSKAGSSMKGEDSLKENATLPGEPLFLSPMVGLQPCPLVFYRDNWGDVTTFRLLWFQMSYHVSPLRIAPTTDDQAISPVDKRVAKMSCLHWHGEAIPGGVATKLWAFSSLSGGRILCVLAETDVTGKAATPTLALHFRGDDNALLYSLTGSKSAREAVVAALCPGKGPSA